MTRQIVLKSSMKNRRQPLLSNQSTVGGGGSIRIGGNQTPRGSRRFAEVAGGTTAECAAVCCCCPCGIMNFLVLAVYKVPAGLCRKALKNKRIKKLKKNGISLQQRKRRCNCGCDETEIQIHPLSIIDDLDQWPPSSSSSPSSSLNEINHNKEVEDLENEMWDRFYSTGFWRSPSQRDDLKEIPIIKLDD